MDFFRRKGGYGFGGCPPPPFTDKIRKVAFDVLSKKAIDYDTEELSYLALSIHSTLTFGIDTSQFDWQAPAGQLS